MERADLHSISFDDCIIICNKAQFDDGKENEKKRTEKRSRKREKNENNIQKKQGKQNVKGKRSKATKMTFFSILFSYRAIHFFSFFTCSTQFNKKDILRFDSKRRLQEHSITRSEQV